MKSEKKNDGHGGKIYVEVMLSLLSIFIVGKYCWDRRQSSAAVQSIEKKWTRLADLAGMEDDCFTHSSEWHFNKKAVRMAACAVQNYAEKAGIQEERWELTHMYCENGIFSIFVRSETSRELFLLVKKDRWLLVADIQRGNELETKFMDGSCSYDSDLDWSSFEPWFSGEKKFNYKIKAGYEYDQYDFVYPFPAICAMEAYLTNTRADRRAEWEVMYERFFAASSGSLVDVWYTDGKKEVHLVMDVGNKRYTVIAVV